MQVTETLNEGLKREIKVIVPASDLEAKLGERLESARTRVRINGFRPGRVPPGHLRKLYGKSLMAEIVNEILTEQPTSILSERGERSATRPEISMTEDEDEANKVLSGEQDFVFSFSYEVMPAIEIKDHSSIKVTRPLAEITDQEVDEQVAKIAESTRAYEPKDGAAETGDRLTIDFVGKIDGEPFEGGSDTGSTLVIGSKQFIPGFEDQLVGAKAGDERQVKVTFPEEYGAAHLAGKEATFDVTVKEVAKPGELSIDDELAKKLGIESVERLRQVVREQLEGQYGGYTRQKVKRQILDALDAEYRFDAPAKLVDTEFNNIWIEITRELAEAARTFADEETTEEEAREEYRRLAERRVRLGLVLGEIGEKAGVTVTEQELQAAIVEQMRRYPGQEQQIVDFFRKNPEAVASIRAPIFEEKVIDQLLATVTVTDKIVSKEELMAEDEADEAKASSSDAPAKKAKSSKASAKEAAAASEDDAEAAASDSPAKKAAPKKRKPAAKATDEASDAE
jgi:trigger factor